MNIWAWVYDTRRELADAGHGRLAEIVSSVPEAALEHRFEAAAALVQEGLALAGDARVPWVEVFLRHWGLQARVANRGEGATALTDAVTALELAHRDDTQDCPQSVCTVQDLAICYSRTDGIGWASERLAVTDETLEAINPSWPCFACITAERAAALTDLGRPEEALSALDEVRAARTSMGEFTTIIARLEALLGDGQWGRCIDEARQFAPRGFDGGDAKTFDVGVRAAYALARIGDLDRAAETLPEAGVIGPTGYRHWAMTTRILTGVGLVANTWQLGATLQSMATELGALGAWRDAFGVSLEHGHLAVDRHRRAVAEGALELAQSAASQLRVPTSVTPELEALAERIRHLVPVDQLPASADELIRSVEERNHDADGLDPEADLELLRAGHDRWPDDGLITAYLASALRLNGRAQAASDLLDRAVAAGERHERVLLALVELQLDAGDELAIRTLADRLAETDPAIAATLLSRHALARGDYETALVQARLVLNHRPDAVNARRVLASAATASGEYEVAVGALTELRDLGAAEPGDEWNLIVAASAAQDWTAVRAAAAELSLELVSTEGPIDEPWGPVSVRYHDVDLVALRTGPATGRVVSVSPPADRQRFDDLVVFDPTPAEPWDPDGDRLVVFPHVTDLERSDYLTYELLGAAPSDEELDQMRDALTAAQMGMSVYYRGDDDIVVLPDGTTTQWQRAMLAVRPGMEPGAIATLAAATREHPQPVLWPSLAEAAGEDATAQRALLDAVRWVDEPT